ncbi:cardiomyopathy-associated protein 5 [Periophthalmus magnuspinnatus]|uniref:cardiomyopathy-associated protein 5 n=1 Tax=Periophthalmus magnuspinnatus TaxID=409849 RepID=UPI00243636BF|nr:cardiomyopathy-associated protein 5 [Periophthalmus magnuspinnatus]
MDSCTEDLSRAEEMTMLTHEDISEENIETCDEVENLQNSFLEAVHDENIQPKMQCLMMDSSFSMVTMQGEDSGIEWETTPSRCNTPWASEAGTLSADVNTVRATGPTPSAAYSAGKIIFVMDEELISRQKKTKEKGHGSKGKGGIPQDVILGSSDNISGRPELVGFSQPNVKADIDECEEEIRNQSEDKEQKLFRLVSEGSEILNIIVPSKMVTVDEEESKEIEDNLSYLEASSVVKANEEIHDQIFELQNEELQVPVHSDLGAAVSPPISAQSMDPPGAPVPKLSSKEPPNVDYFEAFTLIDAQAPGSPAVPEKEQSKAEEADRTLDNENSCQPKVTSSTIPLSPDEENEDDISLVEITSELLDEVFYGNPDNYNKTSDKANDNKRVPSRLSLKPTGATLFGSQEDILTPIYLPEGPPKIIDPILLEEPKALAFLYTDLYEEATGSRKKEEDTESLSSEKSFHSRHSDREARGYLEKYMLIDETPVLGAPQSENIHCPKDAPRIISQNVYEFEEMASKREKIQIPDSEEEVTDFFRSCADSSPCTFEPLSRLAEEDEDQTATKNKAKKNKKHVIVTENIPESTTDSLDEFPIDDPDWESAFDDVIAVPENEDNVQPHQQPLQHMDMQLPVAPPRQKASSRQKACLDLAPLTPVDIQEEMEAGAKEDREEEKETASPAETADEGDGEDTSKPFSEPASSQNTITPDEPTDGEIEPETKGVSNSQTEDTPFEENNETLEANVSENITTESTEEMTEENKTVPHDVAKETGKCIIL